MGIEVHPVDRVMWVPIDKVFSNEYNPNKVARNELRLLYVSIKHDGYTQPVVTVYDKEKDRYVIVDGYHRYQIMRVYPDIYESTGMNLPGDCSP
jgi:ParB-like chromosome segregation protein Spo0J